MFQNSPVGRKARPQLGAHEASPQPPLILNPVTSTLAPLTPFRMFCAPVPRMWVASIPAPMSLSPSCSVTSEGTSKVPDARQNVVPAGAALVT